MLRTYATLVTLVANPDDQTGGGQGSEHVHLPMPPIAWGLLALTLFALGLLALWSFRNTAHQVEDLGDAATATRTGHTAGQPVADSGASTTTPLSGTVSSPGSGAHGPGERH